MPSPQDSYSDSEDDYLPERRGPAVKAGRQVFSGFDSSSGRRVSGNLSARWSARAPWKSGPSRCRKSGEGYFWIGGPGEEAFNVCLGLQVKKGRGPALRLPAPALPQRRRDARDGHADDRARPPDGDDRHRPPLAGPQLRRPLRRARVERHAGHRRSSRCSTSMAPGTALVQKRHGGDGIPIVIGGDAGTAEGDFASCMIWSTRPGQRTAGADGRDEQRLRHLDARQDAARGTASSRPRQAVRHPRRGRRRQRPDRHLARAGRAFDYCRTTRRPFLLEARCRGCTATRRRAVRPACRTSRTA